uniref:Uncharacterized protein n=1 Tax=Anguilla anguilla TaxID=7936 RepID=A0A0E9SU47_ANGAN
MLSMTFLAENILVRLQASVCTRQIK